MTAVVVAPALLAVLYMAPPWGWYIIVAAACVIGAFEFFGMTHPGDRVAQTVGAILTLGFSLVLYFRTSHAPSLITAVVVVTIIGLLLTLWRLGDIPSAGLRMLAQVAGPLYIGGLLTTIGLLRRDLGDAGPGFVLLSLMFAWLGDTFGYFVGRFLGKTKLYEAVSPKKTREGYFGAVAGSVVGALIASLWFLPSLPLVNGVVLALVAGTLGPLGDLVESLLKRSTGIKDSGWIIPGHGGILDRIDAVLIIAPIVYVYTLWWR